MASNILAEKAKEQNIQILQFQNQKLSEQLANLKQQISTLESSVTKHEEQKKEYVDTLLCVNRIWDQLNIDVRSLSARCTKQPVADITEPAEDKQDSWEDFDPFLRRLLNSEASSQKQIKRNVQEYQQDLTEVEQALHARAAASMQSLADLLNLIEEQRNQALQNQGTTADGSNAGDQQLQEEVASLQQQLDAAQALQRSTHMLLKQSQDNAFEAAENLKSIKNELADREYELSAAQRKLQRLKQQQPAAAAQQQGGAGLPVLNTQASAGAATAAGPAAAAASGAAAASQVGDDNSNAAAVEDLQAQVAQLQEMLDQRTAEREAAIDAQGRLQRELSDAQAHQGDESWVPQSGMYQLAQKQLSEAAAQLEARGKALAALQRDNDELRRQFETKQSKEEVEKALRNKVGFLQAQVDELQHKQVELLAQKQQMQVSHQQEMARYGHVKTTAELQNMVTALQKEVDTHAGHARKAAEASAAADAARQESANAQAALVTSQQLVSALKERLSAKAAELAGLSSREDELKERINDLNAFVEVLTTFTSDARDQVEVRRSEAALKNQVKGLNDKLKGDSLQKQLQAAAATETSLRQEVESAVVAAAELKGQVKALQDQVSGLQTEVGKKQAESEAFAQEINEAYNAFEEQRQQNSTLLNQLAERDSTIAAGQADKLSLEHTVQQLNDKLRAAESEIATVRHDLEQLSNLKKATDADFTRISAELAAAREQVVAHMGTIEQLRQEIKQREDDKAAMEILFEQERKSAAAKLQSATEEAAALAEERTKRQKLEDSNKLLAVKVDRMMKNSSTSEAVQELEDEINALRRLLRCNVCHTRQKDVIITKCWHMFCKPCITKNLEARHRKCPGCGHQFGAADVKQFFFT